MDYIISGIQQIGVGVSDAKAGFDWYKAHFGADVQIFDENAVAALMLPYTGGEPRKRRAILALNLQGGGGFEIWQYTSRTPQPPAFKVKPGDLGIYAAKIKVKDVQALFNQLKAQGVEVATPISADGSGKKSFFVRDAFGNPFQLTEGYGWFREEQKLSGGVFGAVIGVSDIDKSIDFYSRLLGYDVVLSDETGQFPAYNTLGEGLFPMRRVILKHSAQRVGAFAPLLGPTEIELISLTEGSGTPIFKDRFWGDLGFIHLCFDVNKMANLKAACERMGHPFTVDSAVGGDTFDMGEAAGHFTYIEDPDGTLIEFVETHKLPVLKKLGWYLNLRKRNPEKSLPRWILNALRFSKVK